MRGVHSSALLLVCLKKKNEPARGNGGLEMRDGFTFGVGGVKNGAFEMKGGTV